ncbi:MAG: hypothetical protein LBQ09_07680 [Acidobacteriaceae bacterium]|nr:hypothetical protein [Acidobacteriaceae bacterium]
MDRVDRLGSLIALGGLARLRFGTGRARRHDASDDGTANEKFLGKMAKGSGQAGVKRIHARDLYYIRRRSWLRNMRPDDFLRRSGLLWGGNYSENVFDLVISSSGH